MLEGIAASRAWRGSRSATSMYVGLPLFLFLATSRNPSSSWAACVAWLGTKVKVGPAGLAVASKFLGRCG
jgi:hypothetical protein